MSHGCISNPCTICHPIYKEKTSYEVSPYWFKSNALSDEDIDKIAKRVVELLNGNLRSD